MSMSSSLVTWSRSSASTWLPLQLKRMGESTTDHFHQDGVSTHIKDAVLRMLHVRKQGTLTYIHALHILANFYFLEIPLHARPDLVIAGHRLVDLREQLVQLL